MAKLFAFEQQASQQTSSDGQQVTGDADTDDLLIDKVIKKDRIDPDSVLITDKLKKQRAVLKGQIENAIAEDKSQRTDQQSAQQTPSDEEDGNDGTQQATGQQTTQETPTEDDENGGEQQASGQQTAGQQSSDDKPEDDDEKKPKEEPKEGQDASTESYLKPFKLKHHSYAKASAEIKQFMKDYTDQLGGVRRKSLSFEELPATYTAAQMNKFLMKLGKMIEESITECSDNAANHEKGLLLLNEKLTLLKSDIEQGKRKFSDDADIKTSMLFPMAIEYDGSVNILESAETLVEANTAFYAVASNAKDYDTFPELLTSNGFKATDLKNEYQYKTLLPGLNDLRASLAPFTSYLDDDLDETEFFSAQNKNASSSDGIYESAPEQKEAAIHFLELVLEVLGVAAKTLDSLRKIIAVLNENLTNVKVTMDSIRSGSTTGINKQKIDSLLKGIMLNRLIAAYAITVDNINISFTSGSLFYIAERYVA